MADDINPELRAELNAAAAVLAPQIRGLHDLSNTSISGDLKQAIAVQIEIRERRMARIAAVLGLLDAAVEARAALERDGYPDIENPELPDFLFTELEGEDTDLEAAVGIFKRPSAQNMKITLGESSPKPSQEKR